MPALRRLMLIALLAAACANAQEELLVSWGHHNAPPYALAEQEQLKGGVIFDIGREAARRCQVTAGFRNVPRARYEAMMRSGDVHMTCITQPEWLDTPQDHVWSPPLFEEHDIVVQASARPSPERLADLRGKRIGTIKAYRYPTIEALFARGEFLRDDATSLDVNMQRLGLGRVDAVIDADIPVRYWLQSNGAQRRFTIAPLNISRHPVHCAISRRSPVPPETVRAALAAMVEDGTVRRILASYGN